MSAKPHVMLTLRSYNQKTGPIPVSTSEASTCPPSCPFMGNGCYAGQGPIKWQWDKVGNGAGHTWDMFLRQIQALPPGMIWRHNQAGDLAGAGDGINAASLEALSRANRGRRGFTYTHKPVIAQKGVSEHRAASNRKSVQKANNSGFTVNLSADTMSEADELAELGIGPVVVALPKDQTSNTKTPAGRPVIICPYYKNNLMTCSVCQLCQKRGRKTIVGFPAHGTGWAKVDRIARGQTEEAAPAGS